MKHSMTLKVYYEDTDAGAVMYHASHIRFMERARTELLASMGVDIARLQASGYYFVVTHIDIKYKAPAYLGDVLTVTAEIEETRKVSLTLRQEILRGETTIAQGLVSIAYKDRNRLLRLPPEILSQAG